LLLKVFAHWKSLEPLYNKNYSAVIFNIFMKFK